MSGKKDGETILLRISGLQKSYQRKRVLKGINLEVRKGEVLGIIGASGSGKTTLLHTMIGFLKPEKGSVEVLLSHQSLGKERLLDAFKHNRRMKAMFGFASQIPSFYDNLTVRENLVFFGSLYGISRKALQTNADILLHLMDLVPAGGVLAKNLSGGMERRLDIACALMHDPSLLILDEPTADLDPLLRSHIYDLIRKINAKDTTIVLASHHLSDIEQLCDRIVIIRDGTILASGSADDIKDKFSAFQHVHLRTRSGHYRTIEEFLHHHCSKSLGKVMVAENEMLVLTHDPEGIIKNMLQAIHHSHDKLDFMQVSKASLDDVFISIMGEEKRSPKADGVKVGSGRAKKGKRYNHRKVAHHEEEERAERGGEDR